ncbi:hypothetical protein L2703_17770 [Shewanella basaltis]|uniref:Uncharacterized protein n=1 Tax=Shewanella vesiculosa TaxID=518738 RepID=A0ABV0FY70_9GAMM|nr:MULTISPECIES: hypothetical protein [Shewanella]NCQ47158.1 hypothetical protein [Shewanella frigidimarina]MBB1322819.1 hypothetical protein [Shewanella sp. SR43-8]MCL1115422.1 hypothetical protein [Shewanella basaltis]NCO73414.1 hypothetical protein [Shewanella vesiculosa]NCP38647.1 hypothetical protein [Shewanella vesiculosa]
MSNISNLEDYRTPTPNTENSKVTNTRKYKDVREREYLTSSEIERISKTESLVVALWIKPTSIDNFSFQSYSQS